MSGGDTEATVLVVDDEREVADAYALRVDREYTTRTAYGGEAALDAIDDDVDVVLLDRRMPDMSGDEVLEAIRADGYDCAVVMVTAVAPDFDIIEMGFDDYLEKPVGPDALFEAIERQLDTFDRDAAISELFSVTAKVGVLEAEKSTAELDANEEYQRLKARADELREQIHGEDDDERSTSETRSATRTDDATSARESANAADTVEETAGTSTENETSGPEANQAAARESTGPGSTGGFAFTPTVTAAGFVALLVALLAGTFTSPMAPSTQLMVGGGQILFLGLALVLGVKHGEYRVEN